MRWAFVFSGCILFSLASMLSGGEVEKSRETGTVERWIDQLGSGEFRIRDTANRALAQVGAQALPQLRKALGHPDPEVRRRVEALSPSLEAAQVLSPKRVYLRLQHRPLKDAVAELSKLSGYKLVLSPDLPPNDPRTKLVHDFRFDGLTFWQALEELCATGGLTLQQNFYGDDSIRLNYADTYSPFICQEGIFRVVAIGFDYGRSIQFGMLPRNTPPGQPNPEHLNFNLSLMVEPRLPLLGIGPARLTAAHDEEKRSLLPPALPPGTDPYGGRRSYHGGYRSYGQQVQANLVWPVKAARSVSLVKGVIPVTLLTKQDPTVVTDKLAEAKGKKFEVGGSGFLIEDIAFTAGKQYQIKLAIDEEKPQGGNEYTRIHSVHQRLEVQDAAGVKYRSFYNSISTTGASHARVTLTLDNANAGAIGPPAKLVYYNWATMEHEVGFEFKDLPLP